MKRLLFFLALLVPAIAMAQPRGTYLGQPGRIFVQDGANLSTHTTFSSAVAATVTAVNPNPTIHIGEGTFGCAGVTSLSPAPGTWILGAGTNKSVIVGAGSTATVLKHNHLVQDVVSISNSFFLLAPATNNVLNRVQLFNDDWHPIFMDEFAGTVNTPVHLIISNSFVRGNNAFTLLGANGAGMLMTVRAFNSEFVSRIPLADTVATIDIHCTNSFGYFVNCKIKADQATNFCTAFYVASGAHVLLDNCEVMVGTNAIRRNPAIGAFTAYTTNLGSEVWYQNMSGAVTNLNTGNGFFRHKNDVLFNYVWPVGWP